MYHAGLITQLWTAALMRNSYECIALSSGDCRNDRVSTPLISVLTGGHSSMSALRPGSVVRRSWFCWTAHPDRLGQLHGSGDVDCQMLIREHTSSISMTAPSYAGTWRRIEWVYTLFVGGWGSQCRSSRRVGVMWLYFCFLTISRAAEFNTDWSGRRWTAATWVRFLN